MLAVNIRPAALMPICSYATCSWTETSFQQALVFSQKIAATRTSALI